MQNSFRYGPQRVSSGTYGKYPAYYDITYSYLKTIVERVKKRFPPQDVEKLDQILTVISEELMPEMNLNIKDREHLS